MKEQVLLLLLQLLLRRQLVVMQLLMLLTETVALEEVVVVVVEQVLKVALEAVEQLVSVHQRGRQLDSGLKLDFRMVGTVALAFEQVKKVSIPFWPRR